MPTMILSVGRRPRALGFSLVELMVAIVIGMLSMLVVLQVFTTFEEQKRVSTGGSESIEHGAITLNMLASRIGQAGFGMMVPDTLDCLVQASIEPSSPTGSDTDYTFRLRPVFITQGASGAPDQISIMFGTSPMITGGVNLLKNPDNTDDKHQDGTEQPFYVSDSYGFSLRNKFIVTQPYSGSGARTDCSLREATEVSNASPYLIRHASRHQYNADTWSKNNKQGGSGVAYKRGAKVYNFGSLAASIFAVRDGNLRVGSPVSAPADWELLLDNVVSIQALYGFDTRSESMRNGTLVVDTYSESFLDADNDGATINSEGGDVDDWLRLGAVRIGIVVRTSQAEMASSRNVANCTVTTSSTVSFPWSYRDAAGTNRNSLTVDVSKEYDINGTETTRADWRCYRYKTFETVVALRNVKWNLPK